ncbi:hypothetical protein D3C86_1529740 [compost metagenome]
MNILAQAGISMHRFLHHWEPRLFGSAVAMNLFPSIQKPWEKKIKIRLVVGQLSINWMLFFQQMVMVIVLWSPMKKGSGCEGISWAYSVLIS